MVGSRAGQVEEEVRTAMLGPSLPTVQIKPRMAEIPSKKEERGIVFVNFRNIISF
jgi:hypothetical protein